MIQLKLEQFLAFQGFRLSNPDGRDVYVWDIYELRAKHIWNAVSTYTCTCMIRMWRVYNRIYVKRAWHVCATYVKKCLNTMLGMCCVSVMCVCHWFALFFSYTYMHLCHSMSHGEGIYIFFLRLVKQIACRTARKKYLKQKHQQNENESEKIIL